MFWFVISLITCVEAVGRIHDRYSEAQLAVEQMKTNYGVGVSTKIILYNGTPETLTYAESDSWSGRWEVSPPLAIPPGKYAAFLHVKTSGVARGSWGFAQFRSDSFEKLFIGWSTPWCWACILYSNKVGVEVAPSGHYPDNIGNLPTQTRHKKTSDPENTSFMGTAEIKEDYKSTLVYFECLSKNI